MELLATEPLLQVNDLSFRYRDRAGTAIRGVNLQIQPGELFLIAGPSGCGKTTLVRCVNGLIPRSYKGEIAGEILIAGKPAREMSLARISQHIGTVLQDPERQILGTKVINEVAFGLENQGLERAEIHQRVKAALEHLHILHLRDRETYNLSGGEKQKVALAGVLAMEPSMLILDEPLASLDPASAVEALKLMRSLVDEGMAVAIVEHRVEDVLKIHPSRAIFMDTGEIVFDGSPQKLMQKVDYHEVKLPASVAIERAAADPPMVFPQPHLSAGGQADGSLVRFENVSFFYEAEKQVLTEINLDVHQGDIIAVLGPNGAGKTTLVKHAIGLLEPKAGSVFVEGNDTRNMSVAQVANTLGYVFQSPSHMLFAPSVRAELRFGPGNLGHTDEEKEEEVQQAIEIMNLSGMEDDPPLALSFGQQKRVSIAAVLAMRSKILVMDEPTAGQDYRNYMDFMDAILQIPSFEAILFITHDIDMAVVYANRVLLLSDGRLVRDGKPEDILADTDLLRDCRLVPTSLLEANLTMLDKTARFMRAEALAHVSTP